MKESIQTLAEKGFIGFKSESQDFEDNLFRIYGTLGEVQLLQGDTQQAAAQFRKCRDIAQRTGSPTLQLNYQLYKGNYQQYLGRYKKAIQHLEQALAIARKIGYAYGESISLAKLGVSYQQLGEEEKAFQLYGSAEQLAQRLFQYPLLLETYTLRGLLLQRKGQHAEALQWFDKGIEILESSIFGYFQGNASRQLSLEKASLCFAGAVTSSIQLGQKKKAYQYVLRTKARTLNDLLIEGSLHKEKGLSGKLVKLKDQKQELLARLNDNYARLIQASADASSDAKQLELLRQWEYVNASIREEILNSQGGPFSFETPSVEAVQQSLQADEALVEYFVAPSIYTFVISKEGFEVANLGTALSGNKMVKDFTANLEAFIDQLQIGKHPILQKRILNEGSLSELHQSFWQPVEATGLLKNAREVIVVPDGELFSLPFEALNNVGSYLLNEYQVVYYPSGTTFFQYRQTDREEKVYPKDLLFIAKSNFEEYKRFNELSVPASGPIAGLFERSDILAEEKAHIDTLLNQNLTDYRYIYISAHGFIDSVPELSYLALQEKPLTLYQAFDLNLNNELVVLSACETARGNFQRGTGIMGFTRGLLYAGAQSLLISLWKVDDQATEQLMIFFFRGLSKGLAPALALSEAKQQLRDIENGKYDHP